MPMLKTKKKPNKIIIEMKAEGRIQFYLVVT